MNEQIKLTTPSKKRTLWTCINCAIILLFMYVGIFHQYHNVKLDTSLLLVFGFNNLTYLKHLWIDTSKMNWIKHLLPILMLLILGLLVVATYKLQKVYYAHQLANHGQTVIGKVELVNTFEFPVFDLYYNRYALVRYRFNNKNYFQEIDNKNQKLTQGDMIMLRLSTQHPQIIEAVDN